MDHHAAHDLIGCQDIAWDVAGAMVELGLDPVLPVDRGLLGFLLPCYCAFQLGAWTMALDAAPDAAEGCAAAPGGGPLCRAAAAGARRVILLRHGQSAFNLHFGATGQDPGIPDAPLTPLGQAQAEGRRGGAGRRADRSHPLFALYPRPAGPPRRSPAGAAWR
ncbi:hypothetical protein [Dankookia sp. P2]|uniref:hypothetical protein n=1 Tax=Dankookia sp. P2 TaxID=3423955 RepID=UPI003D67C28C